MKLFRLLLPVVLALASCVVAGPAVAGYGGTTYRYDAGAAARYALRWSDTLHNPDYPQLDDDSANFVSQALEAGGWNRRATAWTPGAKAWTRADDLYRFAVKGRAHAWTRTTPFGDDLWHLAPGDLLFADWTSDGTIDHVMIVVGRDTVLGFTEPTISQHSPHRHDLPLSIAIKVAALEHDDMSFYPVTPKALYQESTTP